MSTPSYRSEWEELNSLRLRQGLIITPRRGGKETIRRLMVLLGKAYNERDELKAAIERVRALVLDMESARVSSMIAASEIIKALDEKGES